jgi:penicillin-binding protein 1B
MLYNALAHSYNVATARLGLALGLDQVIQTLRRLGVSAPLKPYPSLLLGTMELSPLEVTAFYQSFASGGYLTPLRGIRAVMNADGELLQRYPLKVTRVIDPGPTLLITRAMQAVVAQGTARGLNGYFSSEFGLAGKTGTTDDMRDSWFAGFDGERLGVVWMGRDDNQPMGLTGSAGAMQIWRDLFRRAGVSPLLTVQPDSIEWRDVDSDSGGLADTRCQNTVQLPFLVGSQLPEPAPCAGGTPAMKWFKGWFE